MVETRRLTELTGRLEGLLDLPGGRLVVALSGGADSATLAYLLSSLGRPFRTVHVNHGFPASGRLEEAARAVAAALSAPFEVAPVRVEEGASPEGQARRARYSALITELGAGELALTAHTMDDQAETVIMNLLRGSGPAGLAGIPPRSGSMARPMLRVTRSETRELAGLTNLPFYDDPMNLDTELRRNAVRLEVIPELSSRFNPKLIEALARSASLVRSDQEFFEEEADALPLLTGESSIAVAVGALLAAPRPVADRLLRRGLAHVRPPHGGTAAELEEVWAVARAFRSRTTLSGEVEVARDGPLLVVRRAGDLSQPARRVDLGVGTHTLGRFEIVVERVEDVCRVSPLGHWSAIFEPEARLSGEVDESGRLLVAANHEPAWVPGQRRLDVAWYEPGTSGYLSVFAREESGWTSSP